VKTSFNSGGGDPKESEKKECNWKEGAQLDPDDGKERG